MPNNDLLNSLKAMLGDNADEKINTVVNLLKDNSSDNDIVKSENPTENNTNISEDVSKTPDNQNNIINSPQLSGEGLEYLAKIKNIIDDMGNANDPRSNLLMSLRPYMRETRQKSIDNAVKILNLSRFSGLFNL